MLATAMSLAGYIWVILNEWYIPAGTLPGICPFRSLTELPCPSCGSTHAVLKLLELRPVEAFYLNPLGFILLPVLLIIPLWLVYDALMRSSTFYTSYTAVETFIKQRPVSVVLALLVAINWLWNIYKY